MQIGCEPGVHQPSGWRNNGHGLLRFSSGARARRNGLVCQLHGHEGSVRGHARLVHSNRQPLLEQLFRVVLKHQPAHSLRRARHHHGRYAAAYADCYARLHRHSTQDVGWHAGIAGTQHVCVMAHSPVSVSESCPSPNVLMLLTLSSCWTLAFIRRVRYCGCACVRSFISVRCGHTRCTQQHLSTMP